ncbi:TetR/AcrR family transcriptional regulator [Naasia lichenicola]|uniref:TetR/AcrR family transcriptional regulator n=1 Tax=Naasia lichenicola TaxID=2565933 RepID=A0A4S4FJ14_9MICO|nr:TetR/AcrR family transcriptional regulator [Naasia lichenicola]
MKKAGSARERLLAASDELFYSEGIHTVGIDRVLEKANVAKGSLYYNFAGGKDELVETYLANRHGVWKDTVERGISAQADPVRRILAVFDTLGELFSRPDFRGCAFMNAAAEARPDSVEMLAAERFRSWIHELFGELTSALDTREPDRLALQLVVLYDGATTTAQMDHTAAAAAVSREMAELLLSRASGPAAGG